MLNKKPLLPVVTVVSVLTALLSGASLKAASVAQTGFEHGDQPWALFVAAESNSTGCALRLGKTDTHLGTTYAILSAKAPARLGLHPKANPVLVVPGEKYRFTTWVKAGPSWTVAAGSPGVVLRCTLHDAFQKDLTSGHLFVGLKGVSSDPAKLTGPAFSSTWTKIEGVVEIPSGAAEMIPFVFVWKGSGEMFIDDISIDKVPGETLITPVLN